MKIYSEDALTNIYNDLQFKKEYDEYFKSKSILSLIEFINKIELNKKYYRLTSNTNNIKFKKYVSDDTKNIKEINSLLNKLTDKNFTKITQEIKTRIEKKDHLETYIINIILEKSITQTNYIHLYVQLILLIYPNIDITTITKIIDDIYISINSKNIDNTQSEYLQFCDKNKKIDKIIGHSLLVTECEKNNLVKDKIHILIKDLLNELITNKDQDIRFRCIKCIYTIFKSLYNSILPEEYIQELDKLKSNEKNTKIKFKIMDILERK